MLTLKNVSKTYDEKVVLNKINISLNHKEIVGLVGNNGEGKTTLLKIISGEILPDTGNIEILNEEVAYLPQQLDTEFDKDISIEDFLKSKISNLDEEYKIPIVLSKTNLKNIELSRKCNVLSGGQKTRLYIASILLKNPLPSVLLLDEPTNNLDMEGLNWLENFIREYKGIVVLTSHDRFFLDNIATKIIEIKNRKIETFGGNYSFYKEQKQIQENALYRAYETQQKKIEKVIKDINVNKSEATIWENRFSSRDPFEKKKAAKSARAAVVRQKRLERFLESEKSIEKPKIYKIYGININGKVPSGKLIVEVKNCSKKFDNKIVFNNVSFSVYGNERVWLMGENGSGKTTLLNMISDKIKPDTGDIKLGTGIKVGCFSQDTQLDLNKTGLEELLSTGTDKTICYNTAFHVHLYEEDLRKRVGQLSRGQISKLEFIKLILEDKDLLILDEPTNHLEIEVREEIENALKNYNGAMIVVSHDRYFIEKIGINQTVAL